MFPSTAGPRRPSLWRGNKTQMGTGALDSYFPLHEQKKLRILAVTGPERDESHKEIPSMTELGYPQVKIDQMTGVFGPPGLPKDRLDILIKGFQKAAADPEFKGSSRKGQTDTSTAGR